MRAPYDKLLETFALFPSGEKEHIAAMVSLPNLAV